MIKYALVVLAAIGAYAFIVRLICGVFKLNDYPSENGLEEINEPIRSDGKAEI